MTSRPVTSNDFDLILNRIAAIENQIKMIENSKSVNLPIYDSAFMPNSAEGDIALAGGSEETTYSTKSLYLYLDGAWREFRTVGALSVAVKCTVTDGIGSYLIYNFTEVTDCYISAQLYWPMQTLTDWLSGTFVDSPLILTMQRAGGTGTGAYVEYVNLRDTNADELYDVWEGFDFGFDGTPTHVAADTWHTVEVFRGSVNGPGPAKLTVDGSLLETVTFAGNSHNIGRVLLGPFQNHVAAPASGIVYIGRVSIGTTEGGNDILDFDPSTAVDLSAFTVVGTCVLETPPTPAP